MAVVGIDTGGTFCDLVVIGEDRRPLVRKALSTPDDNSRGVFDVLGVASDAFGGDADFFAGIGALSLGTTIATNTVVTRSGGKVGLLTTRGHGDLLSIMRVNGRVAGRPLAEVQNYSVTDKPTAIVPKSMIVELDERIDVLGSVIVPLKDREVETAVDTLIEAGATSIAVSLLWGFLNPVHERAVETIVRRRHPGVFVSLGSNLSRRLGEYERTESAVVNGYVAAAVRDYLDKVSSGLSQRGLRPSPLIMHTAGGVGTEASARDKPITTLFSGPAGGIVAAKQVCAAAGFSNAICADVGGTTFDVGLIVDGRPLLRSTTVIDQRVMYCSTIDVISIGTGGGSIARVEPETRRLQVGPRSAGAAPGPACYGRGGADPTVTDAALILGYLDPDNFLGGRFKLHPDLARDALRTQVGGPLGINERRAAAGIFAIANAKMADLVRKVTVERGLDPRDFVLCAYGGLGPLHAPFYAHDLSVKAVLIPLGELSSVFSAYGIATADILHVHELSVSLREPFATAEIEGVFERLADEAHAELETDGVAHDDRSTRRFVEVRYVGQLNDLTVEVPSPIEAGFDIRGRFEAQYVEAFGPGAAWTTAPIEIVGCRLEAIGRREQFEPARLPTGGEPERTGTRDVFWPQADAFVPTPIFAGSSLGAGAKIVGPAVIEFPTTTVVVPPGWRCEADVIGNLLLQRESAR